jgi:hypothetical protein
MSRRTSPMATPKRNLFWQRRTTLERPRSFACRQVSRAELALAFSSRAWLGALLFVLSPVSRPGWTVLECFRSQADIGKSPLASGLQGLMGVGGNAGSISKWNSRLRVSQRVGPGSAARSGPRAFLLAASGRARLLSRSRRQRCAPHGARSRHFVWRCEKNFASSHSFASCQSVHQARRSLRWVFSRACTALPVCCLLQRKN